MNHQWGTVLKTVPTQAANAGLTPVTQIKVSGCSGMAFAHSRGTSCAANHRRGDSFGTQCCSMSQARTFMLIAS